MRIEEGATAADVSSQVAERIGLEASLEQFALVELTNKTDTRILQSTENVAQTVRRWNKTSMAAATLCQTSEDLLEFKLIFMKVICSTEDDVKVTCPVYKHIEYSQALHVVRNYLPLEEYECVELAALQTLVDYGPNVQPETGFLAVDVLRYIPQHVVARSVQTREDVFRVECDILLRLNRLWENHITVDTAKNMYLDLVRRSGLYGCIFYDEVEPVDVYEDLPKKLTIGINEWGIHVMDATNAAVKSHVMTFDYYDVKKWTTSSTQLALHLGVIDDNVKFVFRLPSGKPKEAANFMKVYVSLQASRLTSPGPPSASWRTPRPITRPCSSPRKTRTRTSTSELPGSCVIETKLGEDIDRSIFVPPGLSLSYTAASRAEINHFSFSVENDMVVRRPNIYSVVALMRWRPGDQRENKIGRAREKKNQSRRVVVALDRKGSEGQGSATTGRHTP